MTKIVTFLLMIYVFYPMKGHICEDYKVMTSMSMQLNGEKVTSVCIERGDNKKIGFQKAPKWYLDRLKGKT